jgi:hypothetical protein
VDALALSTARRISEFTAQQSRQRERMKQAAVRARLYNRSEMAVGATAATDTPRVDVGLTTDDVGMPATAGVDAAATSTDVVGTATNINVEASATTGVGAAASTHVDATTTIAVVNEAATAATLDGAGWSALSMLVCGLCRVRPRENGSLACRIGHLKAEAGKSCMRCNVTAEVFELLHTYRSFHLRENNWFTKVRLRLSAYLVHFLISCRLCWLPRHGCDRTGVARNPQR